MICALCGLIGRTCIHVGSVTFLGNVTFLKHEIYEKPNPKTISVFHISVKLELSESFLDFSKTLKKTQIWIFTHPL